MSEQGHQGRERREFTRIEYTTPLAYKVCKREVLSKMALGYSVNVSQAGIFCHIDSSVTPNDVVWLNFDRGTLDICEELERRTWIYQSGVIGRVVRIEKNDDGTFGIGVQFITREEARPNEAVISLEQALSKES
jgi:hypothetical protein